VDFKSKNVNEARAPQYVPDLLARFLWSLFLNLGIDPVSLLANLF